MQPPNVVFPDVELVVVEYLRERLAARPESFAAAEVDIRTPAILPRLMVRVRRDGGARLDHVREAARMTVLVYAENDADATDLTRLVRALMWAAPGTGPIVRVVDNAGPVAVADESGRAIRSMAFEVVVRGTNLPADLTV